MGRTAIAFIYHQELIPKKDKVWCGSLLYILIGVIPLVLVIYFLSISKYWLYIHLLGVALQMTAVILCFWMPESIPWLLK